MKKRIFEKLLPRLQDSPAEAKESCLLDAFVHEKHLVMDFYTTAYTETGPIWAPLWRTVMNSREYANYDHIKKMWNNKLLRSQEAEYGYSRINSPRIKICHVEAETERCIRDYIDEAGGYLYKSLDMTLYHQQVDMSKEIRKTANEKRFIRIQNRMNLLTDPPGDFRRFIMEKTYKNDHILYFGKNGAFCTRCGREVEPKKKPKHNMPTVCPACRRRVLCKHTGYMKEHEEKKEILYIQQAGDDIILRYFKCSLMSEDGKKEDLAYSESVRTYHRNSLGWYGKRYIQHYDCLTDQSYWDDGMPYYRQVAYGGRCSLYTGNMEELKTILNETYLEIMSEWASEGAGMPLKSLIQSNSGTMKMCERLYKAGLKKLAREYACKGFGFSVTDRGMELKKILGITKPMMQHLRERDGGLKMLEILRDAYENNRGLNDGEIFELADAGIKIRELAEVSRKNKIIKTLHYLQGTAGYKNLYTTFTHYEDYLSMAQYMGYDMDNGVRRYPKNLKIAHDRAAVEFYQEENDEKKRKAIKKFPLIGTMKKDLDDTYGYNDGQYAVTAPRSAGDIIEEGRSLHHCVGGDNYLRKHNDGKSFILFMRRTAEMDTPYYTLEIDPETDGILQYYGLNDKKPDKRKVDNFLKKWKEAVKRKKKKLQKAAG